MAVSPGGRSRPESQSQPLRRRTKPRTRHKPVRRPTPYAYRPGSSPLHRLPGGIKLLGLLLVSTLSFIFGLPALGAGTALVLAGALIAGIRPWELLRGVRPLLGMILLMILCRAINPGPDPEHPAFFQPHNFIPGLLFGWSILLSFSAAALLFSVTTMTEIKDSLDLLGLKRLSLGISLMLGFLPRFFVIWETAETAYRARCGKKDLSQISLLAPLVIERMLEMAAETAAALESRGCSL